MFVNCTLKKSPRESHTKGLVDVSIGIMEREAVDVDYIRLVDHHVPHGEAEDMTEEDEDEDEWPIYSSI